MTHLPQSQIKTFPDPGQHRLNQKLTSLVHDLIQQNVDLSFAKRELEAAYIREILKKNKGNIGLTAKELGIHRNTLSKRIKDLRITERT